MKKLLALAVALLLASCAGTPEPAPTSAENPPLRIAALSYETAEVVAALGLVDQLVIAPAAVTNPALSNHSAELAGVPLHTSSESGTDPEIVLAQNPDVVLLSPRHGLEAGLTDALTQAGVSVVVLPNTWHTVPDMLTNIELIGQAVGAPGPAQELSERVDQELTVSSPQLLADPPRIVVLSNQAGQPFITAGAAFPLQLIALAGGMDASAEAGFTRTGPIEPEQLIAMAPDGIVLVDMNGSGRQVFDSLLENPAVAPMAAVADGRILEVSGAQVQAIALERAGEGLDLLTTWLAGLRQSG